MTLFGVASRLFYEWRTRRASYDGLLAKLQRNQEVVHARMVRATGSAFNRTRAAHVIGIERWSAHRLRVLLGEPLTMDEYDGYAPSDKLSMAELAEEFKQTREATIALVRALHDAGVGLRQTVKHNEAGELSVAAWIFYIVNHTWREAWFVSPLLTSKDAGSNSGNEASPSEHTG